MFYPRATLSFLALRGSILQRESGDEVCLKRVNFHSSFSSLSSLQFVLFFFLQREDFLIVRHLHTTNAVLIVFAYSQRTIHTKSTLSWREDCSVLALQSTIFFFFFLFFHH